MPREVEYENDQGTFRVISPQDRPIEEFNAAFQAGGAPGFEIAETLRSRFQKFSEPATRAVAKPLGRTLAEFVVPQSPVEAATMLTPLKALKAVPILGKVLGSALGRIGAGTAVGEGVGMATGEPPGRGAMIGGGGTAAGETAGALGSKLLRSLPGARQRIGETDVGRLAEQIEETVPPLRGRVPKTAAELQDFTLRARRSKYPLGDAYEAGVQEAEQRLGGQLLEVPSLSEFPLSLTDATERLSTLGQRAFGGKTDLFARTMQGKDRRALYENAINQITRELNRLDATGEAAAAYNIARIQYRSGIALLSLFRAEGGKPDAEMFRAFPDHIELNWRRLQQKFAQRRELLEDRLGPDEFAKVQAVVTRGGPLGTVDIPVPGAGRMGTAAMQTFGRGTQTGSTSILGVPLRTLLPNIGAEYAGRAPFTPSALVQYLLDVGGQRGTARLSE